MKQPHYLLAARMLLAITALLLVAAFLTR